MRFFAYFAYFASPRDLSQYISQLHFWLQTLIIFPCGLNQLSYMIYMINNVYIVVHRTVWMPSKQLLKTCCICWSKFRLVYIPTFTDSSHSEKPWNINMINVKTWIACPKVYKDMFVKLRQYLKVVEYSWTI